MFLSSLRVDRDQDSQYGSVGMQCVSSTRCSSHVA